MGGFGVPVLLHLLWRGLIEAKLRDGKAAAREALSQSDLQRPAVHSRGDPMGSPNAALNRVLGDPAVRTRFLALGAEPVGGTPQELAATVQKESEC
jgi:hypothetical protein